MNDTDRPDRETALKLLGWQGRDVSLLEPVLLEDVDGLPLAAGLEEHGRGELDVTPEQLGWTAAELLADQQEDTP